MEGEKEAEKEPWRSGTASSEGLAVKTFHIDFWPLTSVKQLQNKRRRQNLTHAVQWEAWRLWAGFAQQKVVISKK